jgi:hypothetical protein
MTNPNWASLLADAIEMKLRALWTPGDPQVHSVTAKAPEEVEVIYSVQSDPRLRGIRIKLHAIREAPARISESTIGELALNIVTTAILEPRPSEDYLRPDRSGIRWLAISKWIEEIT